MARKKTSELQEIRAITKRTLRKLDCIQDFDALPAEAQATYYSVTLPLIIANEMFKPAFQKALKAAVGKAQRPLSAKETLELLQSQLVSEGRERDWAPWWIDLDGFIDDLEQS